MKRLVIFSIILFFLSLSLAHAQGGIDVKYQIINNQVPPGANAEFLLSVENNKTSEETFTIDVSDLVWSASTDPLTDYTTGLNVPAHSTYTTKLLLHSVGKVPFRTHYVKVSLVSQSTNQFYDVVVPIDIRQDLVRYPLDLSADVSMPNQIDPRKSFSIKIALKNNQATILKNLSIVLNSNLIKQSSIVDIGPEGEKTVEFAIKLDESTKPQKDILFIAISKDGNKVANLEKRFEIVSFIPPFKQSELVKRRLLIYTSTIELTNEGNSQEMQTVLVPLQTFDSIFAKTIPKAGITQDNGEATFAWRISLGPQESTSVQIVRNYMPALYAAIILIIALILYFVFRSPIVVRKKVKKVASHGENITGLKIVLHVKNRSRKPVHTLRLIDKVPNLVGFVRSGMETAKPNKAMQHAGSTVIAWDIAVVEPGEERVFTYELRPKLAVVGGLDLGPAIINFKSGNRIFKKKSNSLDVYV